MQASDVLLVNQRASVTNMSLPSKLTSYFASGRPVIAAVSADSETAWEIEASGAGLVVPPADPPAPGGDPRAEERPDPRPEAPSEREGVRESTLSREKALAEYEEFIYRLALAGR